MLWGVGAFPAVISKRLSAPLTPFVVGTANHDGTFGSISAFTMFGSYVPESTDLALMLAAQRSNTNEITATGWNDLNFGGVNNINNSSDRSETFWRYYGDGSLVGASKWTATSAASGSANLLLIRKAHASSPIGDTQSANTATTPATTAALTLTAANNNLIVGWVYRRNGTGFPARDLVVPSGFVEKYRNSTDGSANGTAVSFSSDAPVASQGAATVAITGNATPFNLRVIEIKGI